MLESQFGWLQNLSLVQLVIIGLLIVVILIIRPIILTQRKEVDARAEESKQRNSQTASWFDLFKSLTSLNNAQTETLQRLSLQHQASSDAITSGFSKVDSLAAANAQLIRDTQDSIKTFRVDVLSALEKLPSELSEELKPLAQEIRALSAMASANKTTGDAIVNQIAGVEKSFLEALSKMTVSPVPSPLPVTITNYPFKRPLPTLAEAGK